MPQKHNQIEFNAISFGKEKKRKRESKKKAETDLYNYTD